MSDPDALPRLYSVREASEIFRCTDRTIRNWMSLGLIVPSRVGRSVRFSENEINRRINGSPAIPDRSDTYGEVGKSEQD